MHRHTRSHTYTLFYQIKYQLSFENTSKREDPRSHLERRNMLMMADRGTNDSTYIILLFEWYFYHAIFMTHGVK